MSTYKPDSLGEWECVDPQGTLSSADRRLLDLVDISKLEPSTLEALRQAELRRRRLLDPVFRASNW